MSTTFTLRIQDRVEHTSSRNPNHTAGGPFPNLPGPDKKSHVPFNIYLDWSLLPGDDPWHTSAQGILPVSSGIWGVNGHSDPDPGCLLIKTDEGSGFLVLVDVISSQYDSSKHWHIWPSRPLEKGCKGDGHRTINHRGGTLNFYIDWQCIGVI
jgi:hypothetical protein